MPYKRRTRARTRRRRPARRRRMFRPSYLGRRGLISSPTVFRFKRKCLLDTLVIPSSSTTGVLTKGYAFKLADIPNHTEFTQLFDQYSIRYIKLYIVHRGTNLSMIEASNTGVGMPIMLITRDYDDNSAPASMDSLREYAKSKFFAFTPERRMFRMGITPAMQRSNYDSAVSTSYSPKFKQYIDCNSPNTPHYAVKLGVQSPSPLSGGTLGYNVYLDIYATYYISFKTVR